MRVVAGRARGRVLRAPTGTATRPTSDRVRESVFNILSSMDVIEAAPVVDLFAGSGALGIEALSRGAASVTFVDHDRAATEAIAANLAVLGDDGRLGRVVRADALGFVRSLTGIGSLTGVTGLTGISSLTGNGSLTGVTGLAPEVSGGVVPGGVVPGGAGSAGVVFADPPYSWTRWGELLGPLAGVADLVVAETGTPLAPDPGWETVTARRYGSTLITVLRPLRTPGFLSKPGRRPADPQPRGGT